jgi:pyridoxine 5-phosphate synthase
MPRLHVNVDHVATLRQARREAFPDPVEWALRAERAGAEGITVHLRKDRRHIQDDDVRRLRKKLATRMNFEMSLDAEIVAIALKLRPHAVCIVPENRSEVTTEGGLDVVREARRLCAVVPLVARRGTEVSLFIDPDVRQVEAACEVGAEFVELHTGSYALATGRTKARELERLHAAALHARAIGLRVNAGHGLDYQNVGPIAALPHVEELNIGFAIVARAVFDGLEEAVGEMAKLVRAGTVRGRVRGRATQVARVARTPRPWRRP